LSVFDGAPLWSDWFRQVGIDPAEAQRGSRFARYADQAIDAAAGGAGVVLGRRFIAMNEMKTGRLASPFGPELEIGISYFAICAKGRESETKISFVLEWLAEESEKL
jgi:LysR family glycine cleavage system transcriptional activator